MRRLSLTLLLALFPPAFAAPALAQVPQTMSYQGVLTDGSGNIVPDGSYDITFSLYLVSSGGTALYSEAHTGVNAVQVSKGGFSVVLGSLTPMNLEFNVPYYLGIQLGTDPELSPRTPLAASPYALALHLPFWLAGSGGVALADGYDAGGYGGALGGFTHSGAITWALQPDFNGSGGFLQVNRDNGSQGFFVDGNFNGSGNTDVGILGASRSMIFNTDAAGDASVELPPGAIDANEILDEPGVAQGHATGIVNVAIGTTMADIVTVTITTPAPGYIVVDADAQHGIGGNASATVNYADIQIDETAGGNLDNYHYFTSGYANAAAGSRNFISYVPIAIHRTYYKGAGTFTFRLEAYGVQNESLSNYLWNPTITARYYPTSYGAVTEAPALAEEARFRNVETTVSAGNGPGAAPVRGALVDLRELELRAARASAAAERAERELLTAEAAAQARTATAAQATTKVKP